MGKDFILLCDRLVEMVSRGLRGFLEAHAELERLEKDELISLACVMLGKIVGLMSLCPKRSS